MLPGLVMRSRDLVAAVADVAAAARLSIDVRSRTKWPREKIEQFADQRTKEIAGYARERSPFYRKRLGDRFADFPALTKEELQSSFDDVLTDRSLHLADLEEFLLAPDRAEDRYFRGQYIALLSGGSSGWRAVFVHDREMGRINFAHALSRMARPDVRPPVRLVTACSGDIRHVTGYYASFAPRAMGSQIIPADIELGELARRLERVDPHVLTTYPWTAMLLLELVETGKLRLNLAAMWCSGEPLTAEMRRRLSAGFKCPVRSSYGTTETGLIAAECSSGRMHIGEDIVRLEVIDREGRAVPDGEQGDAVLVTHLWNKCLPLIRYRFDDRVRVGTGSCACGSQHRWIAEILGRSDSAFTAPGRSGGAVSVMGAKLHLNLLGCHADLIGAQILVSDAGLRANILLRSSAPAEPVVRAAREELDRSLGALDVDTKRFELIVEPTDELQRLPGTGKTFTFRSERARDVPTVPRRGARIEVRLAAPSDDEALLRLFREVGQPVSGAHVALDFRRAPTEAIALRWAEARIVVAVAESGELAGASWVAPHWIVARGSRRRAAYLGGLCVSPSYRRLGLANRMTTTRIDYARAVSNEEPFIFAYVSPQNVASLANAEKWGRRCENEVLALRLSPASGLLPEKLRLVARQARENDVDRILARAATFFDGFAAATPPAAEEILPSAGGVRSYYVAEDTAGELVAGVSLTFESELLEAFITAGDSGGWKDRTLGVVQPFLPRIRRVIAERAWEAREARGALGQLLRAVRKDVIKSGGLAAHFDPRNHAHWPTPADRIGQFRLCLIASDPSLVDGPAPIELLAM